MKQTCIALLMLSFIFGHQTFSFADESNVIPAGFLQQNTHSSSLMSGDNKITTDCSFFRNANICRFMFENKDGFTSEISVPYAKLEALTAEIIDGLYDLKSDWETVYSTKGIFKVHPTRGEDHKNLQLLIEDLENESLQFRVLQPEFELRKTPTYIYNKDRAEQIFAVIWQLIQNTGESQCLRHCTTPEALN